MRFLVDENLPPRLAQLLTERGHKAVHVRDLDAEGSTDATLLKLAAADGRVIVSADTDFGALLASGGDTAPSVILVRELLGRRPDDMAAVIATHAADIDADLAQGAIAAFTRRGVRVRRLPLR